jgi:DNA-binding winged helix-turn-helix (wHTH) protein/Tol biopolymer transport system component
MGIGGGVRAFEKRREGAALRFGPFELDLKSGELRKSGVLIKVQHQPLKVLTLLVSRPGDLVTREEIQKEIWPDGVFVDFEQSLNFCIRHIRGVLNDSAAVPHYIETLPKRGYRWIAPVEVVRPELGPRPVELALRPPEPPLPERPTRRLGVSHAFFLLLGLAIGGSLILLGRPGGAPVFHRLTYRRGMVETARFMPDGQVLFGAAWDGQEVALFTASTANGTWRRLEASGHRVVSSLPSGEFAYLSKNSLFRAPVSGGPPKAIAEKVDAADTSPDGNNIVAVRNWGSRSTIEWPLGKAVAEASFPSHLRLSPRGDRIAFLEHTTPGDDRGSVVTIDRAGRRTELSSEWGSSEGLAWSPRGDEVWFTAARTGSNCSLMAVSLDRRERVVLSTMGRLVIEDIAPDGRVLLQRQQMRGETRFGRTGEPERDLSWLDYTILADLSRDGTQLVFGESGEGGGLDYEVYLRRTDGSVPIRLGHGRPMSLSPDGSWVASVPVRQPDRVELLPTGPGEPKVVKDTAIEKYFMATFFPDGRSLLVNGARGGKVRGYIQPIGGPAHPVTPDGTSALEMGVAPDGKHFMVYEKGHLQVYPTDGGAPRVLSGENDRFAGWKDAGTIYVVPEKSAAARIEAVSLASGARTLVREVGPSDTAGVLGIPILVLTPDASAWAYSYARILSDLYLVDNLR